MNTGAGPGTIGPALPSAFPMRRMPGNGYVCVLIIR